MKSNAESKQIKHTSEKFRKYFAADGNEVMNCEGSDTAESETVEMITAEINEFRAPEGGNDNPDVVISTVLATEGDAVKNRVTDMSVLPVTGKAVDLGTAAVIIDQSQQKNDSLGLTKADDMTVEVSDIPEHAEENVELQLNDVDGSTPTAICVMEMSENSSAEQPTLLTVQKMEEEGSAVYVQVVEVGKAEETEDSRSVTKQVLTVSEDGTVEMVEVMWDDMVSSEQDIHFE
jgi:hypothetical protein